MNSATDYDGGASVAFGAGGVDDHDHDVDTGTIAWLLPEIVAAFDTATTSLRAFRAGAAGVDRADVDLAPLRVARSQLHQAHGALELGGLAGVTRVTEAMEDLLGSFQEEPARCDATALDALTGACRAVVEYLEDLQGDGRQQPLYLFPSYRDLLTARGVDRIHPADLFAVDLGIRAPRDEHGVALDSTGLRVQRATFEQALLRYLRNENDRSALASLSRTITAIDGSVARNAKQGQAQQRTFWWVARALFEALANEGFVDAPAQHPHLKRVAGRINLQIRKLAEGSAAVAERLMTDTLYFVAVAAPVTPLVRDVQARFGLVGSVPTDFEQQRYGRIDPSALRGAREAIASAKLAWSAIVSGELGQIKAFARDTGALVSAVGAIKRRGVAQVAQVIDGIATDLGFDPRQPAAAVGLDVATALLFLEGSLERARSLDDAFDERAALVVARVEASALGREHPVGAVDWLDRMSRQAEERLTVATFVAELQASLRNAEKVLDAFFREPAERGQLAEAHKSLGQASGALALLGHDDVHRAIEHARTTIEHFRQDPASGDSSAFEELAASLGAVGFYVDQIKRDRIDASAFRFDEATGQFSAEIAGAPVRAAAPAGLAAESTWFEPTDDGRFDSDAPVVQDEPMVMNDPFAATDLAFAATEILEPDGTLEDEVARRASDANGHATRLREHPDDPVIREQLAAAVDDVRRNAMLIDDRELQDEAASVLKDVRQRPEETLGFASAAELADRVSDLAAHAFRSAGMAPAATMPDEPAVPVRPADDVEAIDAELLEIFLEEAGGVLVEAEASLRVLDADPLNTTATVNLRRGFHTLKGSGRMVGLMAFGEAAWSIEETLNDHIASQRAAPSDLRALIDYAIRYLDGWASELRTTGTSSRLPDALIEAARVVRTADPQATVDDPIDEPVAAVAPVVDESSDAMSSRADDFAKTLVLADADGDFAKTLVLADDADADADFSGTDFAATQVLDDDSPMPDLEFFGVQPQLPVETAFPELPALEPAERTAAFDPLMSEIFAGDEADARVADSARDEPTGVDESALPVLDAPVPADDGIDLDFDLVDEPATAPPILAGPEADPIDVGPIEVELPLAAEPVAAIDNVVAFTLPRSEPPAREEVREIGSLTLSVALFNIYLTEADELLRVLTQDFAEWRHELDRFVSEGAIRAVHSLAGSSATVGLVPAHDLAAAVEDVLQALWREPTELTLEQVERLQDAVESLRRMLHRFAAERMPEPDPVRVAGLLALRREIGREEGMERPADPLVAAVEVPAALPPFEPLDVAEPEAAESLASDAFVAEPIADDVVIDEVTIDGPESGSHDVEAPALVGAFEEPALEEPAFEEPVLEEPAHEEPAFEEPVLEEPAIEEPAIEEPVHEAVHEAAHEAALEHAAPEGPTLEEPPRDVAEEVVAEAIVDPEVVAERATEDRVADPVQAPSMDVVEASVDHAFDATVSEPEPDPRRYESATPPDIAMAVAPVAPVAEPASTLRDDIDPELLDIFVTEGGEILPQIGALLRDWQAEPGDSAPARLLLRHLHTLKGSARMAGAMRLGEVVHDIEARVESAARLHDVPPALLDELLAAHDRSLELFDRLQNPVVAEAAPQAAEAPAETDGDFVEPVAPTVAEPVDARTARVRDARQQPQQAVRVASDTLDRLVNLAGEVSISRARIENEVLQIKGAMSDLNDNVERLRTQLREIELQAEFQMQSQMQSQQASGQERDKFDPLEFDRFTRFQELTRMMAESVNDVKTLQQHLQKSLDNAETDLSAQRRMTRDLQQDLMRVRMVPFASIAERLYRVARRTAKEVDKRVNLDIRGGSVEIDRGVLERMAGPFEHLLRNHIVHGIETRDARRAAGKDETGELLVEVRQEGNEIVVTFADDGAGLDLARIRAKGVELGLLDDVEAGDARVADLIFHPGFTTASEVTELAGRGVGMDVVRTESMALAGRVSVDSEAGRGTRFTINLPVTLAITQVVLVAVASRIYAIPAVLVEQVQQLRPQPLADAYRAGQLSWAGANVRLAFLGTLLGVDDVVPVAQRSSPVLVLRSAGERIAIHVDEVVGNQEVVVKNLGPQLARMTGIAGATVLGSGEIVLILNPVQLSQMSREQPVRPVGASSGPVAPAPQDVGLKTLPTVMVVDDSLTVRRVTQRLLSREGYQVVLAKDGVDALEQLQDFPPDVMLVDIEMPRMDGFDLTRNVRSDERYRHIPIVMITSRTAEKHRRHAADLGVDAYIGKPYQEDELLDLLAFHVKRKRSQPA